MFRPTTFTAPRINASAASTVIALERHASKLKAFWLDVVEKHRCADFGPHRDSLAEYAEKAFARYNEITTILAAISPHMTK